MQTCQQRSAKAYLIENDLKRLDAYDKIVESLGLDPSSNRTTFPINKWRIDIETSRRRHRNCYSP